ncbi:hypothetical protein B0H12DRAFT_1093301 [Mycena haematopus]|nr:hypothetical protein B0H12DRAFT_1093301 [Mycena haematopus]
MMASDGSRLPTAHDELARRDPHTFKLSPGPGAQGLVPVLSANHFTTPLRLRNRAACPASESEPIFSASASVAVARIVSFQGTSEGVYTRCGAVKTILFQARLRNVLWATEQRVYRWERARDRRLLATLGPRGAQRSRRVSEASSHRTHAQGSKSCRTEQKNRAAGHTSGGPPLPNSNLNGSSATQRKVNDGLLRRMVTATDSGPRRAEA